MGVPESRPVLRGLSALKLALLAQQARERSEAVLRADPIAIIGMGCRLPGGVSTPDDFWRLLRDGADVVSEVPPDRWDVEASYDPDPATPGKAATKRGGFIGAIDRFDAAFFGILPREAERMDPQHRLFLEVAHEALDHAGLPRERLQGSRTGAFVASYYNDYAQLAVEDPLAIDARTLTGSLHSVLVNRLSYLLDLRGPSVSVDTACSSSLVAIHLACQSLRHGECDVALAGGVSLMVTDAAMITLSKVGFMAPDGRCKTFDASANGFGRGEGCSVIILKRLADAMADGDRVLAVIRGSAVNQDGHSTVLAAPNGLAQQALVVEALANAQVDASRIGYVEAHGTGTMLGDPIEVEALAATVGRAAPGAAPCLIGAAKANIGHLEAAAGVTGLIKSVLVLRNEAIPPQANFTSLNPHIRLEGTRLAVATQLTPWKAGGAPRLIGTSSFGVGGTNAHVIIEESPRLGIEESSEWAPAPWLLPLSAQSPSALTELARRWRDFLAASTDPLPALCAMAGERRSHFDHRLAVVGGSIDDFRERLNAFIEGAHPHGFVSGRRATSPALRVAFVFSGQGQQWLSMGRGLLDTEPVFRDSLADLDARLKVHTGWSLLDELAAPAGSSRLAETQVTQPAIFAMQVALVALWKSWGIEPDGVVGHSVGEIAALHTAGLLALDDAVRIVTRRASVMQRAEGRGAMAAVGTTPARARELVAPFGARLSIGAINSPRSVVLSGEPAALAEALAKLDAVGVSHRAMAVNCAFHSAQMDAPAEELVCALGPVASGDARIPVYSTVNGCLLAAQRIDVAYFGRNVRDTVLFGDAVAAMLDDGFNAFVEIAAHPVLAAAIADTSAGRDDVLVPIASMRRGRPDRETMLLACASLHVAGRAPRWEVVQHRPAEVIDLPQYPWQRERYWLSVRAAKIAAVAARPPADDLLLGHRIPMAQAAVFESSWRASSAGWLADHRIDGQLLMPGMAMLELMRAAASHVLESGPVEIVDLVLHRPLVLEEGADGSTTWQVIVRRKDDAGLSLTLHRAVPASAGAEVTWHDIASASARPLVAVVAERSAVTSAEPSADVDIAALYDAFESQGAQFGPSFRNIERLTLPRDGAATAWLRRPPTDDDTTSSGIHPAVLDGAVQACVAAAGGGLPRELLLPLAVESYRLVAPAPDRLCAELVWTRETSGGGSLAARIELKAPDGTLVATLDGVRCVTTIANAQPSLAADDALHEIAWVDAPSFVGPPVSGAWLLLCDSSGVGRALAAVLAAQGQPCLLAHAGPAPAREAVDHAVLVPGDAAGLLELVEDSRWRAGQPLAAVVHLWSLDESRAPAEPLDAGRFQREDLLASVSAMTAAQALARAAGVAAPRLLLVTDGAQWAGGASRAIAGAGLWGLANTIAVEHPEIAVRVIDLDPDAAGIDANRLAAELRRGDGAARRSALRGARQLVPRLRRWRSRAEDAPRKLALGAVATLDALRWDNFTTRAPESGEVRVRVHAAGVNFRDVLLALGMIPREASFLGAECAGIVTAVGAGVDDLAVGDAVFGFAPGSLATEIVLPAAFLARWPDELGSLERAASLPAAYLTAMLGFDGFAGGLSRGQRVLIHAAAGGVGMAAVQLARRAGAEVFATAGSPAKRALLRSLGVDHVFDSRTTDFAAQIRSLTRGEGVDVVLNSLSGEFIAASVESLAADGCFLELGKRDLWSEERFAEVRREARFRVYDLGRSATADPGIVRKMLVALIEGLRDGSLEPLPLRVFDFDDAADAFRLMAQARHVGKLVLRAPPPTSDAPAARPLVRADATYWITGGFGALGLHTARWLASRGARHLVLTSRRAPDDDARAAIADLERQGVRILVRPADVGDPTQASGILREMRCAMPRLAGVVHAAGALDDGVLLFSDRARFERVLRGKAIGARVLDALTRDIALDFFVLYSAAGQLLGAAGQGAYASANAELDALAYSRRAAGLPALSVAWGLWQGGGMASELSAAGSDPWSSRGLAWIGPQDGFAHLERLLREDAIHAAVLPIDWHRFMARLPAGADPDFFRDLVTAQTRRSLPDGSRPAASPTVPRHETWRALPESQRRSAVMAHLAEQALQVLGVPPSTELAARMPLKEAGLDSLMAVELRNALTRSIGLPLPATLLFDHPSLEALATYLLDKLGLAAPQVKPTVTRTASTASAPAVAALSDEEAEAQLLAELGMNTARSRP